MMVYIDQDFESIIPVYLSNIRRQVEQIENLLVHNQFKDIERIAMQIRDSGQNYGFMEIGQLGIKMIYYSGLESVDKIRKAAGEIISYIEKCEIEYIEL